ncbi:MAG: SpoIIIAH-like family protein [Christensenellaceae bacterium]|nr:SpoIIIAH-like family protein [Christensenellaceae bacterium]
MREWQGHSRVPGLSAGLGALLALAITFTLAVPALYAAKPGVFPSVAAGAAGAEGAEGAAVPADAIERFRGEREQMRAVEMRELKALIADVAADAELRDEARRQLLGLTTYMEQEATIEGVLRARGFEDALCTVHEGSVNVLVRADALTRAESAVILELALRETKEQSGNIKIIPIAR